MKKDKEYDGVIYEPSADYQARNNDKRSTDRKPKSRISGGSPDYARYSNGVARRPQNAVRQVDRSRAGRSRSKKKSNFAMFYVFTLFTGIMICIVIFTIFFSNLSKEMNKNSRLTATAAPSPTPTEIVINEMQQVLGVIDNIDVKTGSIHLLDVTASKYYDLYYDSTSELTNKFGQSVVFSEFRVGDMVDANFNPKTSKLKSLSLSSQSWEYKQIKNVSVNPLESTITIGNDVYEMDDNLVVIYNNDLYPIHSVSELDLLTVRGYRNKASSIIVLKSHGGIEIINKDYIINGYVEVDTDVFLELASAEYIELQEGPHRIVVKGNNIEPYIKEIQLGPKETIRINLEEAVYKTGMLFINANVSDYVVVIDDKQVLSDTAPMLDYGTHTLRLEKTDYEIWQKEIVINAPRVDVNVNMAQIVKMGKFAVNTIPSGAELFVDDKLMGVTPFEATAEQGSHIIMVRKSGYRETTKQIDVADELVIYNIELIPIPVEVPLTVTAAPE